MLESYVGWLGTSLFDELIDLVIHPRHAPIHPCIDPTSTEFICFAIELELFLTF